MAGKDVAFARLAFGTSIDNSPCDITNIDEIVTTADGSFETASSEIDDELGEMRDAIIVGANNSRRLDDAGIKPAIINEIEDEIGGFGFGLGVLAFDLVGVEAGLFGDSFVIRLFGEGVDAIDVNKFTIVLQSELGDILGTANIDVEDGGIRLGLNIDDSGAVEDI